MTAAGRRYPPPQALFAAGIGLLLGMLALSYQLGKKTTTELVIAAVAVALVCVIAGSPRRFLLGAMVLDVPLEWSKNLFWRPALANVGATAGFELSITTAALVGLYGIWALSPRQRGSRPRPRFAPALPLIVYLGVNLISLLAARDKALGLDELWVLVEAFLVFIYVVSCVRTREDVRFLVSMLLVGLVLEALIIIGIYATGWSGHLLGLANRVNPAAYGGRVGGTVGSPNSAAAYLCLGLPLALVVSVTTKAQRLRRLAAVALMLGIIALIITGSRGGWISFAISVLLIAVWAVKRRLLEPRAVMLVTLAIVALMVPFLGTISGRIGHNDNGSAASRVTMAELASSIIRAHPLAGVGVNNVGSVLPDYAGPQFDQTFVYTIHDKYLLVWAEAGIGALLAFLWFLARTLRRGWQCVRSGDPVLAPLALALTAAIAGQLVHMAVDIFASRPQVEGLWLTAALLAAMQAIVRPERPSREGHG